MPWPRRPRSEILHSATTTRTDRPHEASRKAVSFDPATGLGLPDPVSAEALQGGGAGVLLPRCLTTTQDESGPPPQTPRARDRNPSVPQAGPWQSASCAPGLPSPWRRRCSGPDQREQESRQNWGSPGSWEQTAGSIAGPVPPEPP